ncbi:shikimate dehydrogenase [Bartonella krasnovii]|uniref:Shikimate dehydrogenase (NADP(+)) n=1 Tax=Bartonella krasnovii TaxID=2267275 RepID=A0A5B9D3W1_9HYPH|nr:shikimate dehydrogenase [Bartonella krasnovii]QEE12997.1 shikimate dehydrogenase [Bartonella krasnovii]UNF29116.1 shikimate dehydrogenase [Bartonella krasnovii]UNF35473.1 shikimate dehydrogenase [Bartonella krasnovii]UNF37088.1 shikimate dehydrogenase [Bartonella krasnovii]UNF38788.1 shikimate dehydrogenase [Bartonella krasnovii]
MANLTRKHKTTKVPCAFVVGTPINHSKSPKIHNFWLKQYNLQGEYIAQEVSSEEFKDFFTSIKKRGFCGGNITLPHKQEAFHLANYKDDVATMIGAVNTLWYEGNKLCATNSDSYGFSANLDDFAPDWVGETAIIFGAGGAARAILYALKKRGFERICLVNRTKRRAEDLAQHFGKPVEVHDWQNIDKILYQADLIVNTTSIGITTSSEEKESSFFCDFHKAKTTALVTDIVYTPLLTPFLQQAKAHGLRTVDGLGMLLHQAVFGFERWFGIRPQVTKALRAEILQDMGEKTE